MSYRFELDSHAAVLGVGGGVSGAGGGGAPTKLRRRRRRQHNDRRRRRSAACRLTGLKVKLYVQVFCVNRTPHNDQQSIIFINKQQCQLNTILGPNSGADYHAVTFIRYM